MQEVNPLELIVREYYYLENKRDKKMRGKGIFIRYSFSEIGGGKQAEFVIVPSEKIKTKKMDVYSNHVRSFPIASYKFYKPLPEGFIDRYQKKVEEDRLTALEIMLNQQKLPMRPPTPDEISLSSMFAETPEEKNQPREMNPPFIEGDPTFYGTDPNKSSLGTDLLPMYREYLLDKKGGRKSRKTRKSKKSKKSKRSKSRRRR
jgi:hypothetical protein